MPKVIVKSRYITSNKHMTQYLKYMATREGVELLPDDIKNKEATQKQQEFILSHKEDLKSLMEYKEYLAAPTVLNASRAITSYVQKKENTQTIYQQYAYKKAENIPEQMKESPATERQKDFIEAHIKGLDDILEYQDFLNNPTYDNASECITAIAEYNITDPLIYVNYIANRPGVYKTGGDNHGLFSMNGKADLTAELEKLKSSKSVAWTHIVSVQREDAKRLGFEDAESWRKVVAANAPRIAKLYNIDLKNLNILGAFHNEGHHPHIHLFVYSNNAAEGIITKSQMETSGERMRSMFTNSIFSNDMQPLISKRNDLRDNISERIKTLSLFYKKEYVPDERISTGLYELSKVLPSAGKIQYAYLQPTAKAAVNNCLRNIVSSDSLLGGLVSDYFSLQRNLIESYNSDPEKIDKKYIDFVEHFYEPRCGKYTDGHDITTLHNIILKCAAQISYSSPDTDNVNKEPSAEPGSLNAYKEDREPSDQPGSASYNSSDNSESEPITPTRSESYASKSSALLAMRLIASELTELCNAVDSCSHPIKQNNLRGRKHMKHRKNTLEKEEGNIR